MTKASWEQGAFSGRIENKVSYMTGSLRRDARDMQRKADAQLYIGAQTGKPLRAGAAGSGCGLARFVIQVRRKICMNC